MSRCSQRLGSCMFDLELHSRSALTWRLRLTCVAALTSCMPSLNPAGAARWVATGSIASGAGACATRTYITFSRDRCYAVWASTLVSHAVACSADFSEDTQWGRDRAYVTSAHLH